MLQGIFKTSDEEIKDLNSLSLEIIQTKEWLGYFLRFILLHFYFSISFVLRCVIYSFEAHYILGGCTKQFQKFIYIKLGPSNYKSKG